MQSMSTGFIIVPQTLGVDMLDLILNVDADLRLDILRAGSCLVLPVMLTVETLELGGNPDISLVLAQGYEDIVVIIGFYELLQCIGFDIQLPCLELDGLAKLRTLREVHIELGVDLLIADGELCVAIREDAQRTGGSEKFPTDFSEAQDQNVELVFQTGLVNVRVERDIPQQVVAGSSEAVQQSQLGIGEDQSLDLFCFLLRRAVGVAYCDIFLRIQGISQMVDEHGSGFRFREEVKLLLKMAVRQGEAAGLEKAILPGGQEEVLHPLEILIGVLRQEEEPQDMPSAPGPEKEPGFVPGIEEKVDISQLFQKHRVGLVPGSPQEDAQSVFLCKIFGHADAVGIQLGEEIPFFFEPGNMMGQVVPQQSGGGKDRQNRDGTGEKLRDHREGRKGDAEVLAVTLQDIKNSLDAGEEPLPTVAAEFGKTPQNQHQEQAE